jgi:ATPase subunit of ABC transporter with duplicated ATPase domains
MSKKDSKSSKKDKKDDKKDKKEKKVSQEDLEQAQEAVELLKELNVLFRDAANQKAFAEITGMEETKRWKALQKHIRSLPNDAQATISNHVQHAKAKKAKAATVAKVEWDQLDSIMTTWPSHVQAQIKAEKDNKSLRKGVDIESFDIKVPFSQQYLFQNSQFKLDPSKRYCLHGDPGTGKSTLFSAIAATTGEGGIKGFPDHLHVHLCQEIEISSDAKNVLDTVVESFEFLHTLRQNRKAVAARIVAISGKTPAENTNVDNAVSTVADVPATTQPKDANEFERLTTILRSLDMRLDSLGSRDAEDRASKMLRVLGFDEEMQTRSTNALSGGLRMRVALCASFFMEPDILLLDEPTNHLDFPSVLWLENRMRAYRKILVLVSHERDMLERVCTAVISIEKKALYYYQMGFGAYEKKLADDETKMAETVEKFLVRNRNVDAASPMAKQKAEYQAWQDEYYAKQIRLQGKFTFPPAEPLEPCILESAGDNKVEETGVVAPVVEVKKAAAAPKKKKTMAEDEEVDLTTLPRADIVAINQVRFSYNPGTLPWIFDTAISFTVQYCPTSTRVGVMGPNGAGKSTFLKLLTGRLTPSNGSVDRNEKAKIGYFAQHHSAELDMTLTPMEYLKMQFPDELNSGMLRKHLAKVGVTGPLAETRLKSLTHGQRSCVMFAKITYHCPHLLIMDEPTNFLDLASIDSLISATNKYKGALLLVSHNRGFLLKCATQFLSIVPGQFLLFNDLRSCEQSTYTFIADLEAGGSISAKDLVQNIKKHSDVSDVTSTGEGNAEQKPE